MSSKSYSSAADNRTQFASGSGVQVAPESAINAAGAGSVNASAGAFVQQSIQTTTEGLVGDDVAQILGMLEEDRASERQTFAALSQNLASSLQAQSQDMSDILAAAKTPDAQTLRQILPVLLVLVLAYFLMR